MIIGSQQSECQCLGNRWQQLIFGIEYGEHSQEVTQAARHDEQVPYPVGMGNPVFGHVEKDP